MASDRSEERTAQCSVCANKSCPDYTPRTGFALFAHIVLGFTVGAVSVAIVVCSFMLVRWCIAYLSLENLPVPAQTVQQTELTCGLGITVSEVGDMASGAGLEGGLVIMYMNDENAFAGHDVRVNDVILSADGITIVTIDDLRGVLLEHKPGDEIRITVARFEDGSAVSRELFVELVPLSED